MIQLESGSLRVQFFIQICRLQPSSSWSVLSWRDYGAGIQLWRDGNGSYSSFMLKPIAAPDLCIRYSWCSAKNVELLIRKSTAKRQNKMQNEMPGDAVAIVYVEAPITASCEPLDQIASMAVTRTGEKKEQAPAKTIAKIAEQIPTLLPLIMAMSAKQS